MLTIRFQLTALPFCNQFKYSYVDKLLFNKWHRQGDQVRQSYHWSRTPEKPWSVFILLFLITKHWRSVLVVTLAWTAGRRTCGFQEFIYALHTCGNPQPGSHVLSRAALDRQLGLIYGIATSSDIIQLTCHRAFVGVGFQLEGELSSSSGETWRNI